MKSSDSASAFAATTQRRVWFIGAGLVVAALLAYLNSFSAPFVFDDEPAIIKNATIRHVWPPWEALQPPATGEGVSGRPLVNFSFALNYALGGTHVEGYHGGNLLIHALAGLTLFGLVRRTLQLPTLRARFGDSATWLAATVALLWNLHPLLTESVTCVVQRNELLAGLWYLLTLYAYVRSVDATTPVRWLALSVAACFLGIASKEVTVSAPLMVIFFDAILVTCSWRQAWRLRWRFYAGLAASWLLLAALMLGTRQRGGTVGFGLNVSSWDYALTQCRALGRYVALAFWPQPLVLDYGDAVVKNLGDVWLLGVGIVTLVAATAFSVQRKKPAAFLGAWFFAILAPSSSFVPLATQTVAEHRMYLPLAAILVLSVMTLHALLGRIGAIASVVCVVSLCGLTVQRNADYRSSISIWADTAAKCPENARAISNLGVALADVGRLDEAVAAYEHALRLAPNFPKAQFSLGSALGKLGRHVEAITHLEFALQLQSDSLEAISNLGTELRQLGRTEEAIRRYRDFLSRHPEAMAVHYNLANAQQSLGRHTEAVASYETVLRLTPDFAPAHYNLALSLRALGQTEAARQHYERARLLDPTLPAASY